MATPTISLAAIGSIKKQSSKVANNNQSTEENSLEEKKSSDEKMKSLTPENTVQASPGKSPFNHNDTKLKKFWGEEVNSDSIYSIYLKKITYSCNTTSLGLSVRHRGVVKGQSELHHESRTKCDQVEASPKKTLDEVQCLQWETRQIRILKAATLDHIIKYILLIELHQEHDSQVNQCTSSMLEDERNCVAHVMHVLFCTFRLFFSPHELYKTILRHSNECCPKQLNFVLHYWLDHYPEDFLTFASELNCTSISKQNDESSSISNCDSESSQNDTKSSLEYSTSKSDSEVKRTLLIDLLLSQPNIDESLYRKGLTVIDLKKETTPDILSTNHKSISKSSVLELDPRFIAQQLTAIDLENFLSLKPYSLLSGSRSTPKIQYMIRNFNLLSRHVIITILKAHSPHVVASHWIEVALQLRKIRNFNSLKAIIAGLTNESVYRLKQVVWSKISRASLSTFKWLSTIVDDVNNQTLLRHTQLIIEGTSKVSLEDESFGTIPYLGTFLTDITMIDSRYPNYIQSKDGLRLINLEKCSQQYEILMQIQLLQKNVIAALTAIQQQSQQIGRSYLPVQKICTPTIPRVARIFRIWFQANDISLITDKECYEISLALEASPTKRKDK